MAALPILIEVETKELVKLLVIDDEQASAESLKTRFEDLGYSVDIAESPERAKELLRTTKYQLIICDQLFDAPEITGDEFFLENESLIGNAKKIIITGQGLDRIGRRQELEKMGVPMFKKGKHTIDELKKIAGQALEEQRENLSSQLREAVPSILQKRGDLEPRSEEQWNYQRAIPLLKASEELLVDWLRSRQDPDRKGIFYAGQEFSPGMLISEIEHHTEVGEKYLGMYLAFLKHVVKSREVAS